MQGNGQITKYCGKEITAVFNQYHKKAAAKTRLGLYQVGNLV